MLANTLTGETEKCRTGVAFILHPWSATFSYLLPTARKGIYLDLPLKSLNTRLSVLDIKWGLFWTMSMACSWQDCHWALGTWWTWVPWKYVRRQLLHFGQGFVNSQRSTFLGMCLPWKVQQSLGIPTPPCHLSSIELVIWIDLVSTWHFFLQVSKKFILQSLWFSFVCHFLETEGLFQQQSIHSEIWL